MPAVLKGRDLIAGPEQAKRCMLQDSKESLSTGRQLSWRSWHPEDTD